ncbi:MAG: ATP-binding protein [Bacilli bacterium]
MNAFDEYIEVLATRDNRANGDYNDPDGYLTCGKCHTRKQYEVEIGGKMRKVPVICKCEERERDARRAAEKQERFRDYIAQMQRDGLTDTKRYYCRFEQDDGSNPRVTTVCKNYVTRWAEMREKNIGIIFYGPVGTGKTHMAACIVNALIDKMIPAGVTNIPTLLNRLQGAFSEQRQDLIEHLQRYELMVVDDLGVERNTPYASEQLFNIIDSRSRSGKPIIITTNMTIDEMENAEDMQSKRIYDRIKEMCPVRIAMNGPSKRTGIANQRRKIAEDVLKT